MYPQHVFRNAQGEKEQMSVGVAQNAVGNRIGSLSEAGARGRNWHQGANDNRPGAGQQGLQLRRAVRARPQGRPAAFSLSPAGTNGLRDASASLPALQRLFCLWTSLIRSAAATSNLCAAGMGMITTTRWPPSSAATRASASPRLPARCKPFPSTAISPGGRMFSPNTGMILAIPPGVTMQAGTMWRITRTERGVTTSWRSKWRVTQNTCISMPVLASRSRHIPTRTGCCCSST